MLLNVIESYIVHAKRIFRDRWTRTHLNATVQWTVAEFRLDGIHTFTEFDEKLWLTTIDAVTVHADGRMTFKFQGGTEIKG